MSENSRLEELLASLLGGAVALAVTLLARDLFGTRLLAEIVVDASTQVLQPRGFSGLISLLGSDGKPLLFLTVLIGQLAAFVLAWRWSARGTAWSIPRAMVAAAIAWTMLLLATVILVTFTEARMGGVSDWLEYALVTGLACFVFGGLANAVIANPAATPLESSSRRAFLLRVPALFLGGAAVTVVLKHPSFSTGGGVTAHGTVGQETPEVTANDDFYIVSKNLIDPDVSGSKWRLRVGGVSATMLELKLEDVMALPAVDQYTTLQCISNEVGGPLMSNALWRGVTLRDLLARVQPGQTAEFVMFRSEDDYVESLPLDFAMKDGVLLAHTMNGEPLPQKHGFPLRLLAPGRYGMNQPKWITEIVLVDRDMLGYWGKRAWSPRAPMATSARIDVPAPDAEISGPTRIHGVAFSGDRGISKVEVTTDEGKTWRDAVLKPALSPYTWVLWYYDWPDPSGRGRLTLQARATDGTGELQSALERPPYPSGATGNPKVSVRLKPAV